MSDFYNLTKCLIKSMFRGPKRSKASKIGLIIGALYLFLFFGFTIVMLSLGFGATFINQGLQKEFLSLLFLITQAVVLIFSTAILLGSLYFSKDHELLGTLPLKSNTIFWSKLFIVYLFAFVLSCFVILCGGIPFGIVAGLGFWFYFSLVIATIIVPFIAIFVASLVLILLIPIINKLKSYRVLLSVILIALITASLYFYFKFFTSDIFEFDDTIRLSDYAISVITTITNVFFFDTMLANMCLGQNVFVNLIVVLAFNVCLVGLISLLTRFTYIKGVQNSLELAKSSVNNKIPLGESCLKTLFRREILSVTRYTSLVVYCSIGLIIPPIFILFYSGQVILLDKFSLTLIFTATITMLSGAMQLFALSSFTREGEAFASLKSLPIKFEQLANVKLIFSIIMMIVSCAITFVFCEIIYKLPFWCFAFMVIISLLMCFGLCCYSVVVDSKTPRLQWGNIYNAMQNNPSSLKVLAMSGALILVCLGWYLLNIMVFKFAVSQTYISVTMFIGVLSVIFAIVMYIYYKKTCAKNIANIEP